MKQRTTLRTLGGKCGLGERGAASARASSASNPVSASQPKPVDADCNNCLRVTERWDVMKSSEVGLEIPNKVETSNHNEQDYFGSG